MAFNWESVYYPLLLAAYCTSSKENCSYFVDSEIVWSSQHMGGRSATEKDCDRLTEVMATSRSSAKANAKSCIWDGLTPCDSRVEVDWLESSFAEKDIGGPGGQVYWHALVVMKTNRVLVYINKYVASRFSQSPSIQFLQHCIWSILSPVGVPSTSEILMCWREASRTVMGENHVVHERCLAEQSNFRMDGEEYRGIFLQSFTF